MSDANPTDDATVWEALGRSGLPAWCVLSSKTPRLHLVSVWILGGETATEVFTDRREAIQHATLLLVELVRRGWTIVNWVRP